MSSKFFTAAVVAASAIAVSSTSIPSPTLQSPTIPFDLPVQASPSTTQGPDLARALAIRDNDDAAAFISCGFNNFCTAGKQYCTSMVSMQPNGVKTTCYCPVCCAVGASCTGACPKPFMIWTILSCPASKIGRRASNTSRAEAEPSGLFAGVASLANREVCITSTWVGTQTVHLPAIAITVTEISTWRGVTTVMAPPVTLPAITSTQTVPGSCNAQTVTITATATAPAIILPAITSVQTVPGSCSAQTVTVTTTATASAPASRIGTETIVTTIYSATTVVPSASTLTVTKTVTDKITNLRTLTSIPPPNTVTATSTAISVSTNNLTATMLSTLTTTDEPPISVDPVHTVVEFMSTTTPVHVAKSTNQAAALHAPAWLNPAAYVRDLAVGRKRNVTFSLPSTAPVSTVLVISTTTKIVTAAYSPSTQVASSSGPKNYTTTVTATRVDINPTTILSTVTKVETGYHTSTTVVTQTATANQAAVHRPWKWIRGAMAYPIDILRNITSNDEDDQMAEWQQERASAKQENRWQSREQDIDPHAEYHDAAGRGRRVEHQHLHDSQRRTETKTISQLVTSTIWVDAETPSPSSSSSLVGQGLKKRDL